MSHADAIRTLQRASEYIFSSQIARSSRKTMHGRTELWQAMATLDECRNAVEREERGGFRLSSYSQQTPRLSLICGLSA